MRIRHRKQYLLLFFITLFFTFACSGGGGSSGPLAVYSGLTTPADLTISNTDSFVAATIGEVAGTDTAGGFLSLNTATGNSSISPLEIQKLFSKLKDKAFNEAKNSSATGSSENTSRALQSGSASLPCDNTDGQVIISGTIDDVTSEGNATLTFSNCLDGDMTLNGTFSARMEYYDATLGDVTLVTGSVNFSVFGIDPIDGPVDAAVSGTIISDTDVLTNLITVTMNVDVVDYISGQSLRLDNFVTTSFAPNLTFPVDVDYVSYDGRIYLSTEGYVTINTMTPLTYTNGSLFDFFPDGGGPLVISGDGGDSIEVLPLSTTEYELSIDADGDGFFESITTELW